jgi:drug/metabolite transporter superfamily protein YnfA
MKAEENFEKIARDRREGSFVGELWGLMREHRKYWLMPIVIVLLLFGLLVTLSGTAVAPFIYTLF